MMRSTRLVIVIAFMAILLLVAGLLVWYQFGYQTPVPTQLETASEYQVGSEPEEVREYSLPAEAQPAVEDIAENDMANEEFTGEDTWESIEADLNSTVIYEEDFSNL